MMQAKYMLSIVLLVYSSISTLNAMVPPVMTQRAMIEEIYSSEKFEGFRKSVSFRAKDLSIEQEKKGLLAINRELSNRNSQIDREYSEAQGKSFVSLYISCATFGTALIGLVAPEREMPGYLFWGSLGVSACSLARVFYVDRCHSAAERAHHGWIHGIYWPSRDAITKRLNKVENKLHVAAADYLAQQEEAQRLEEVRKEIVRLQVDAEIAAIQDWPRVLRPFALFGFLRK